MVDYLWFGDMMTDLPLEPVETMFAQLNAEGFTDEEAIRLMTVLATLCLGHARDVAQAQNEGARTRRRLLKSALEAREDREFPNLERIASRNVDTYGTAQLAFSVELLLEGAEETLRNTKTR